MNIIEKIRTEQHGYVTAGDVPELVKHDRFTKCLVKTSMGRFTCSAQDVKHFVDMVDGHEHDYVRDVQIVSRH